MFKKTLAVLALSFAAIGATSTAQAEGTDQVVHPNSACKWETDTNQNWTGNFYNGMFQNDPVSPWHLLVCGIDRFNLTNTNGLRDLDIRLTGSPVGPDDPTEVFCEGLAMRPDGSIVKQVSKSITFTEHGSKRLDFNGEINQSVAYGAYVVSCTMPRFTTLNNILQREY